MGQDDNIPPRRASIRLVPPQTGEGYRYEDPTKASSSSPPLDPNVSPVLRRSVGSFNFDLASSPALGESAITPPQPSQVRFDTNPERYPHARNSSNTVPWLQSGQPFPSFPSQSQYQTGPSLAPPIVDQSRFSQNSSSLSDKSLPPSPTAHRSRFSRTTVEDDSGEGSYSPPGAERPAVQTHTALEPMSLDSSPPPLALRHTSPLPSPRGTPTPSAWRSLFTPAPPEPASRVSVSTTSPNVETNRPPPTPSPPLSSSSSSSSFDGTSSPPLAALPAIIAPTPRRNYSSSSQLYAHPFPTTLLEAIAEDEASYMSGRSSFANRFSQDGPQSAQMETQTLGQTPGGRAQLTSIGTAAALAAAAGVLDEDHPTNSLRLHTPPPVATLPEMRRLSVPPQIPPLPPFDHNTSGLQRLFSYFPSPKFPLSPRIPAEAPHLSQGPFSPNPQQFSAASSVLTFGSVCGPQGERFSSEREKRQSRGVYWVDGTPKRTRRWCGIRGMSWKMWAVVLLLLFLVFGVIAVGLGVGLGMNGGNGQAAGQSGVAGNGSPGQGTNPGGNNNGGQSQFPAGIFKIMTNLRNVTTGCTNVSATWNCAPGAGQTFWEAGVNSSAITVVWKIRRTDEGGFTVSSADDPFALRFSNASLTLREAGTESEHWGFEAQVKKRVRPFKDVSDRNAAVECEYDRVTLRARLFDRLQPDVDLSEAGDAWPGAVETEEVSEIEGSCAEVRNGVLGQQISVGVGPGECVCGYSTLDLGSDD